MVIDSETHAATFDRMRRKVQVSEAVTVATVELASDNVERRFDLLERDDRINRLLEDLKAKRRTDTL